MSLRKYLNLIAYIIAPTHDSQENLKQQLDATSDKDFWGTSSNAQQGMEAFMGLNS